MARSLFLGVDAGGTHTRSVLIDERGSVVARGSAGAANHWTSSTSAAIGAVRSAIVSVLRATGAPPPRTVTAVGIGWSGLEAAGSAADARRFVGDAVRATHCVLDSDVFAGHVGAFGGESGVLVAAGTGSIALGVGDDGRRTRVGGWGHRYGDEGSAVWIAAEAIRAALRSADGRDPPGPLWSALRRHAGVTPEADDALEQVAPLVTTWLYAPERHTSEVATFARTVHELAEAGDVRSRAILAAAGRELAQLAHVAADRLAAPTPIRLACSGGVWQHNPIVRETFREALAAAPERFRLVEPIAPPDVGAALMAMAASGRPLASQEAPSVSRRRD